MSSGLTMTTRTILTCPASPLLPLGHGAWSSYRAVTRFVDNDAMKAFGLPETLE